jgi:hypothetical protein
MDWPQDGGAGSGWSRMQGISVRALVPDALTAPWEDHGGSGGKSTADFGPIRPDQIEADGSCWRPFSCAFRRNVAFV